MAKSGFFRTYFHSKYLNVFSHVVETPSDPLTRHRRPLLGQKFWDAFTAIAGRGHYYRTSGFLWLSRREVFTDNEQHLKPKERAKDYVYQKAKAGILDYCMLFIPGLVTLFKVGLWNLLSTMPTAAKLTLGLIVFSLFLATWVLDLALRTVKQVVGFILTLCALIVILPVHAYVAHKNQKEWDDLDMNFRNQRVSENCHPFNKKDFDQLLSEQNERKELEERFDVKIEELVKTDPKVVKFQRIQYTSKSETDYSLSIWKKGGFLSLQKDGKVILNEGAFSPSNHDKKYTSNTSTNNKNRTSTSVKSQKSTPNDLYLRFNFGDAKRQKDNEKERVEKDKVVLN